MQVNEQVRQGQKATRLPDMERAFDDARAKPESRAERRAAEESRRTGTKLSEGVAGTTPLPPRYGSGF
jgi:hypothetical protein